jgi:hypothetical protein
MFGYSLFKIDLNEKGQIKKRPPAKLVESLEMHVLTF